MAMLRTIFTLLELLQWNFYCSKIEALRSVCQTIIRLLQQTDFKRFQTAL
jgi:hypothetical protein